MKSEPFQDKSCLKIINMFLMNRLCLKGISVNDLFKKFGKHKPQPIPMARETLIKKLRILEQYGVLELQKVKNRKVYRLVSDFADFNKEIEDIKQVHLDAIKEVIKICKKERDKKKAAIQLSIILHGVDNQFCKALLLKTLRANTSMKRTANQRFFYEYSDILLHFTKVFLKVINLYGIDKEIKKLAKNSKF